MSEVISDDLGQGLAESQHQAVDERQPADGEQQLAQKEGKRFTQDEVNELIGKRISEERAKSERGMSEIQQRLEKFEKLFANFGSQPEQVQQQQTQIDPNRPLTVAEYQSLMQHQHAAQQAEVANSKINEFITDAKTKFQDFEQVKEQHKEIFDALEKDEVIATAAVATGQPFEFAYNISKLCPDEFKKIANISNPVSKFAEIIRLESKLKQGAKVPNVSGAPSPLPDEKGDGTDMDAYDVQAARRRLAGK